MVLLSILIHSFLIPSCCNILCIILNYFIILYVAYSNEITIELNVGEIQICLSVWGNLPLKVLTAFAHTSCEKTRFFQQLTWTIWESILNTSQLLKYPMLIIYLLKSKKEWHSLYHIIFNKHKCFILISLPQWFLPMMFIVLASMAMLPDCNIISLSGKMYVKKAIRYR